MSMAEKTALRILVTGGSGFLGGHLVRTLLERHPDWKIVVLDQNRPDADIEARIGRFVQADITSAESVANAFVDLHPDLVIHTAGIVPARKFRYSTNSIQWEKVKAINHQGTVNILDATLTSGCRRLVYTSSCTAVTDDLEHDYAHVNENAPLGLATLHYGKSKGLAERYVLSSEHAARGLKACALRPCTIIGEGDIAVMSLLHDLINKSESYFIVGDGDNLYDFMYIANAVDAHILAAENLLTNGTAAGQAFFVSNQEPVYFWDFLAYVWACFGHVPAFRVRIPTKLAWFVGLIMELLTFLFGLPPTLDRGSVKDGVRTHYSDNGKAVSILGYRPRVMLAEGVRRSCEDYKRYLAAQQGTGKKTK